MKRFKNTAINTALLFLVISGVQELMTAPQGPQGNGNHNYIVVDNQADLAIGITLSSAESEETFVDIVAPLTLKAFWYPNQCYKILFTREDPNAIERWSARLFARRYRQFKEDETEHSLSLDCLNIRNNFVVITIQEKEIDHERFLVPYIDIMPQDPTMVLRALTRNHQNIAQWFKRDFDRYQALVKVMMADREKLKHIPAAATVVERVQKDFGDLIGEITDSFGRYAGDGKTSLYEKLSQGYQKDLADFSAELEALGYKELWQREQAHRHAYDILSALTGRIISPISLEEEYRQEAISQIAQEREEKKALSHRQAMLIRQLAAFIGTKTGKETYEAFMMGPEEVKKLEITQAMQEEIKRLIASEQRIAIRTDLLTLEQFFKSFAQSPAKKRSVSPPSPTSPRKQ